MKTEVVHCLCYDRYVLEILNYYSKYKKQWHVSIHFQLSQAFKCKFLLNKKDLCDYSDTLHRHCPSENWPGMMYRHLEVI